MPDVSRRLLLGSLPLAASAAALPKAVHAGGGAPDAFTYEVTRTEEEWRDRLTDDEYTILRMGGTEVPQSHPLWDSTEPGMYCCKGCDLPIYDARWKVVVPIGFLFYRHCEPDTVLTSIDASVYARFSGEEVDGPLVPDDIPADLSDEERALIDPLLLMEAHCRRCASHLGHLVIAEGKLLHCINGLSLNFTPEAA